MAADGKSDSQLDAANSRSMDRSTEAPIALEIAHVLFIDIVGYSKLTTKEQNAAVAALNKLVQECEPFRAAERADRLLKIPTGDGMALVFYSSPEEPVQCAVALSKTLKTHPDLQVRMGVHSGWISGVVDVTDRANVGGAGINTARATFVSSHFQGQDRARPCL